MIPKSALEALNKLVEKWRAEKVVAENSRYNVGAIDAVHDCADELESALQSLEPTEARAEVPEVTHYQGSRVKCTPHMFPIIDLESHSDDGFDYYLVRSEVKSASPLPKAETQPVAWAVLADGKVFQHRLFAKEADAEACWKESMGHYQDHNPRILPLYSAPQPEAATIDAEAAIKTISNIALRALIDFDHKKISMEHAAAIIANESLRLLSKHASAHAGKQWWVMVPREPTEAMMLAGAKADADQQYLKNNAWERCVGEEYRQEWLNGAKHSYRAMLAAAPIAPEGKKP